VEPAGFEPETASPMRRSRRAQTATDLRISRTDVLCSQPSGQGAPPSGHSASPQDSAKMARRPVSAHRCWWQITECVAEALEPWSPSASWPGLTGDTGP